MQNHRLREVGLHVYAVLVILDQHVLMFFLLTKWPADLTAMLIDSHGWETRLCGERLQGGIWTQEGGRLHLMCLVYQLLIVAVTRHQMRVADEKGQFILVHRSRRAGNGGCVSESLWLKAAHSLLMTGPGSRWSHNPQGLPPVAYSSQPSPILWRFYSLSI